MTILTRPVCFFPLPSPPPHTSIFNVTRKMIVVGLDRRSAIFFSLCKEKIYFVAFQLKKKKKKKKNEAIHVTKVSIQLFRNSCVLDTAPSISARFLYFISQIEHSRLSIDRNLQIALGSISFVYKLDSLWCAGIKKKKRKNDENL